MKTYGNLSYDNGTWVITGAPQMFIRLKALFPRVNKRQYGEVRLEHTPEIARDLEWFMDRFPLECRDKTLLSCASRSYQQELAQLDYLLRGEYAPRYFDLAQPLRDYQSSAVEILLRKKGLLVADQLGLGKSVTAIGAFTEQTALPVLVVCQSHLPDQWQGFVKKFLPKANTHIISTMKNYELPAETDCFIISYNKLQAWTDTLLGNVKMLVFDEIQELRHRGTNKYCAAQALRSQAEYCCGLSATPIHGYGGEIYNIIDITSPGALGTFEEFSREWCHKNGDHWLLNDPDAFGQYLRDEFLMVRRTRKDVGRELPETEKIVEEIPFDNQALAAIEDVATELARRILEGGFHDSGMASRELDWKLRQATGIAKAPYVAALVRMLVEGGEQVMLGAWHRECYAVYQRTFDKAGISWTMYTGSETPQKKRQAEEDFKAGRASVCMMSLRSGAGLDGLQEVCNTIVIGELDWCQAVHDQIIGRLGRDGQKGRVTAFFPVAGGGSDPVIAGVLGLKAAQSAGLLDPGEAGLTKLQTDTGARMKLLASQYLETQGARKAA